VKNLIKRLIASAGFEIRRAGAPNRFQAHVEALAGMARSGFKPSVVIDGGANRGQWCRSVRLLFPDAIFHLVEPQAGCRRDLQSIIDGGVRAELHACALVESGSGPVRMSADDGCTGAQLVADDAAEAGASVPGATLDSLFADRISRADRALLKLDLESFELPALRGATRLLQAVEAVMSEVSFYSVGGVAEPVFLDVAEFLRSRGFELYDFASLSGRRRDGRLRQGDAIFVRFDSELLCDRDWA
jgi:FkbM family methyltransferase